MIEEKEEQASTKTAPATKKEEQTSVKSAPAVNKSGNATNKQSNPTKSGGFTNQTYAPPSGECKIKGNVNSKKEKIYHVPGGQFYDKTKINPEEGDRLFCTEKEAQEAGFRRSKR